MRHGIEICRIDTTYEAHEVAPRRSSGHSEAAREIKDLSLLGSIQAVNFVDDLVFNCLCHNGTNLGKGFLNVKRSAKTNHDMVAQPRAPRGRAG